MTGAVAAKVDLATPIPVSKVCRMDQRVDARMNLTILRDFG
jgi:hypothetical protein